MKENKEAYAPFSNYPDVLSVTELQKALGIGRSSTYRLLKSGEIKSIRIGKIIKIPKRYLIDFVEGTCYNDGVTASKLTVEKEAVSK